MSRSANQPTDVAAKRLAALLADHALGELTPEQQRELDQLLADRPDTDPAGLERVAAALEISLTVDQLTPLPYQLKARLLDSIPQGTGTTPAPAAPATATANAPAPAAPAAATATATANAPGSASAAPLPRGLLGVNWVVVWGWTGWAVAAGLLLWLVSQQRDREADFLPPAMFSPVNLRYETAQQKLRSKTDDVVCGQWERSPESDLPWAVAAEGELIWSQKLQCGLIRVKGLPPNDPQREQYQVWIRDSHRPHDHPIGAGVFNVGPSGEAVLLIHPRIVVHAHDRFFISREPSGGSILPCGRMLLTALACPDQGDLPRENRKAR